jgi:hypothetical protein
MIEALRLLLDLATRAIPGLTGMRKQRRLDNIGVELFLLYIRFNEAIAQRALEQATNFDIISMMLRRWRYEFQVLNGDAYYDLVLRARLKRSALEMLQDIMSEGLVPTASFVEALPAELDDLLGEFAVQHKLEKDALDSSARWDRNTCKLLRHYLDVREPRTQLEQIRSALGEYRRSLEQTFSVTEILPKVGEKALDRRGRRLR